MELDVHERLILLTLLPKEGNYTNLKLVRTAKEALSFDEAENKALNFREVGEGKDRKLIWNIGLVPDKDVELGEVVTKLIQDELVRLDKAGRLSLDYLPVYEKFIQKEN